MATLRWSASLIMEQEATRTECIMCDRVPRAKLSHTPNPALSEWEYTLEDWTVLPLFRGRVCHGTESRFICGDATKVL